MPSYEEDLPEFERYDAQVLGISVDNVPTNKAWATAMGGISYPLLSDFWAHGFVSIKYNILRSEGFSERALFVIDKKGIVQYVDVHPITDQPKNSELIAALKKLK
jgi:peroxiredoxin